MQKVGIMASPKKSWDRGDTKFIAIQVLLLLLAVAFAAVFGYFVYGPQASDDVAAEATEFVMSAAQDTTPECSCTEKNYHPVWEIVVFLATQIIWRYFRNNQEGNNDRPS